MPEGLGGGEGGLSPLDALGTGKDVRVRKGSMSEDLGGEEGGFSPLDAQRR